MGEARADAEAAGRSAMVGHATGWHMKLDGEGYIAGKIPVFPNYASINIEDFKAEVIILRPGFDIGVTVKLKGLARFPCAVKDEDLA